MLSWHSCFLFFLALQGAKPSADHGSLLVQCDHSLLQQSQQRFSSSVPLLDTDVNKTAKNRTAEREKAKKEKEQKEKDKKKERENKRKDAHKRLVENEDHPFWVLDFWHDIIHGWPQLLLCSFLLLVSGMLCASAGIGGNIIQVTVLIAGGNVAPADAVPMSKVVIFLGALGSMLVHINSKALTGAPLPAPLICWDTCRVAVPACLLGTSLGVATNPHVPDRFLVLLLAVFLFFIAVWVLRQTLLMRSAELSLTGRSGGSSSSSEAYPRANASAMPSRPAPRGKQTPNAFVEVVGMVLLLLLVAACGIIRELTENCHDAAFYLGWMDEQEHCNHPFLRIMFFGEVHATWFITHHNSVTVLCTALVVLACFTYGCAAAYKADKSMSRCHIAVISVVVFTLGFLGSLTGIGGGVVLSPFFLILGLSVQQTVATSVVCVIFISASSALQYIITNRVRMAMALSLGLVNAIGSCAGALAMHKLVGAWARSSFIMGLIGFLVSCSFAITFRNFIKMA